MVHSPSPQFRKSIFVSIAIFSTIVPMSFYLSYSQYSKLGVFEWPILFSSLLDQLIPLLANTLLLMPHVLIHFDFGMSRMTGDILFDIILGTRAIINNYGIDSICAG